MPADALELALFHHAFHSVAEEMGAVLRRTAFSPNIKERRDYSCAIFDAAGEAIAMGDHMPVHLGSMPMSVAAALRDCPMRRGDMVLLNDPYRGGTHLPDLTLVAPVSAAGRKPDFYVAARAHHADIGGAAPGSMALAREIQAEGLRIPPVKLLRGDRLAPEILALLLANVRTPAEREGDLSAQIGACRTGITRMRELAARYGRARLTANARALLAYSARLMESELARLPAGVYRAEDALDDDGFGSGPVRLRVALRLDPRRRRAEVDFSGTAPQTAGGINAVFAITWSAVFYVFRCLLPEEAPATTGLMRPIAVRAPGGCLLNAGWPAAVAAGNVETSQRIVDVLLRALARAAPRRVPAASSGTMNNLTVGGYDPRTGEPYAYYETIAGGMGARPDSGGIGGVHTHMTNSLNTPAEALEYAYPLRLRQYRLRRGSGGAGRFRGGDGLVRELELLAPAQATILADRRITAPYGLAGGRPGRKGRTLAISPSGKAVRLPGKATRHLPAGARLRIESPGGGGWGLPGRKKTKSIR